MPYIAIREEKVRASGTSKTAQLMTSLDIAAGYIYTMAFSSDGKMHWQSKPMATSLWDWKTGKQIRALTGHSSRILLGFSPDGKMLASRKRRQYCANMESDNGQQIHLLMNMMAGYFTVRISPDGKLLGWQVNMWKRSGLGYQDHLPLLSLNLPQNESLMPSILVRQQRICLWKRSRTGRYLGYSVWWKTNYYSNRSHLDYLPAFQLGW